MTTPTINFNYIGLYDGERRYEVTSLKNTLKFRPGHVLIEEEVQLLINSKRYTVNIKGAE